MAFLEYLKVSGNFSSSSKRYKRLQSLDENKLLQKVLKRINCYIQIYIIQVV